MSERITAEQVQSDVESYALRASPDGRRRVIREALDKARREGGEDAQAEVARLREALAASEARAATSADALTTIALAAGLGADATAAEVAARVGSLGVIAGLRRDGWAVAVHNDYRLAGKSHTFWLFTKGDRAVKGEGETDEEALGQIARRLAEEAGRG